MHLKIFALLIFAQNTKRAAPYLSYYKAMLSVSNEITFRFVKRVYVKCSDIPFRTRAAALLKRHVKEILKNVVLECTLLVTHLQKWHSIFVGFLLFPFFYALTVRGLSYVTFRLREK